MVNPGQVLCHSGIAAEDDRCHVPLDTAGEARIALQYRTALGELERFQITWYGWHCRHREEHTRRVSNDQVIPPTQPQDLVTRQ